MWMNEKHNVEESLSEATRLREIIGELFAAAPSDQIILTPGTLIGFLTLLNGFKIKKIALTDCEYYSPQHLPSFETKTFGIENFAPETAMFQPDAVIASVVSWQGVKLPASELFAEIRNRFGNGKTPLLIADYAHAGAVGFPPVADLGADIVCGDLYKWITPADYYGNLGFIWFKERSLYEQAKKLFRPFFLATEDKTEFSFKKARWVNTKELKNLLAWLSENEISRARLLETHKANYELAKDVARKLKLSESVQSNIIWVDEAEMRNASFDHFKKAGLAWEFEGKIKGLRLLCRSELLINNH